ncbi:hypothetical protein FOA52_011139 [Chlamydomonas sp. UWO 241]|nr:hypothetical protein FOA52_011139 [Chlamydomonas sp. UWO 241]
MDAYERGKLLGKGSFGCAILCKQKQDGKHVVIKEIDVSKMPAVERSAAHQEAKLLKALKHPNIVQCTDSFMHGNKLCIVMDWCSEGDLYGILQKQRAKAAHLPEDTIMDWFVQMCLGLKHVHDRKILHRDIKTQNVFMSAGGLLKLGDFGVSKVLGSTWALAVTAVGTPYYLSPEICMNKKYNQKSDVWSLGCVLYELTTLKHAFEAPNMRALIQKIVRGTYTPVPGARSKELREVIAKCLTLDSARRPTVNDILQLPFVKARIQTFLSATLHQNEFSHTVIHGRPQPGQLVVQQQGHALLAAPAAPPAAPPVPVGAGSAAARALPAGGFRPPPVPKPASPAALPLQPRAGRDAGAAAARLGVALHGARPGSPAMHAGEGGQPAAAGFRALPRPGSAPKQPPAASGEGEAAARQRAAAGDAARQRTATDLAARQQAAASKARHDRERAEKERAERESALTAARDKMAAAARERATRERAAVEKAVADKAAADAERASVEAAARSKADADRVSVRRAQAAVDSATSAATSTERARERERDFAQREQDAADILDAEECQAGEEKAAKAREIAAMGGGREQARMRMEEQMRKLEQSHGRFDRAQLARDGHRDKEDAQAAASPAAVAAVAQPRQRSPLAPTPPPRLAKAEAEAAKKAQEAAAARKRAEAETAKTEEEARRKQAEIARREAVRAAKEAERVAVRAKIAADRADMEGGGQGGKKARAPVPAWNENWAGLPEAAGPSGVDPVQPAWRAVSPEHPSPQQQQQQRQQQQQQQQGQQQVQQRRVSIGTGEPQQRRISSGLGAEPSPFQPVQPSWRAVSPERISSSRRASNGGASGRASASPPLPPNQVDPLSSDARRVLWEEQRRAAARNRAAVEGGAAAAGTSRPVGARAGAAETQEASGDSYASRQARLEAERARREAELADFQRAHWQEVRAAAERNRRRIMADYGGNGEHSPSSDGGRARAGDVSREASTAPPPMPDPAVRPSGSARTEEHGVAAGVLAAKLAHVQGDSMRIPKHPPPVPVLDVEDDTAGEFAAMVKDMQDVLMLSDHALDEPVHCYTGHIGGEEPDRGKAVSTRVV